MKNTVVCNTDSVWSACLYSFVFLHNIQCTEPMGSPYSCLVDIIVFVFIFAALSMWAMAQEWLFYILMFATINMKWKWNWTMKSLYYISLQQCSRMYGYQSSAMAMAMANTLIGAQRCWNKRYSTHMWYSYISLGLL